jgi:hypothetical protein
LIVVILGSRRLKRGHINGDMARIVPFEEELKETILESDRDIAIQFCVFEG